jgi:DNA-binding NarL/FixJ family response regulator
MSRRAPLAGAPAGSIVWRVMTVDARGYETVRVVAADDQPAFLELERAVVARTPGFVLVGEAKDGPDALRLVRRLDPDVVILDLRMSSLDGIDTARILSREDDTRVILLLTSSDLRSLSELAASAGVAALLHKHWLTPGLLHGLWVVHARR